MRLVVTLLFSVSTLIALPPITLASSPTKEWVDEFMVAFETARKPNASERDIEQYLDFLSSDVTDFHAAYGVTITGKDRPRVGMLQKAAERQSFNVTLEQSILGSYVAVLELVEDSKYVKDGENKHFKGRTIVVLELNDQGKVSHIRRYLD